MVEAVIFWNQADSEEERTSMYTVDTLPLDPSDLIRRFKEDGQQIKSFLDVCLLYFSRGDDLSYKRVLQAGSDSGNLH